MGKTSKCRGGQRRRFILRLPGGAFSCLASRCKGGGLCRRVVRGGLRRGCTEINFYVCESVQKHQYIAFAVLLLVIPCEVLSPFGPETFRNAAECWVGGSACSLHALEAHAEATHGFSLQEVRRSAWHCMALHGIAWHCMALHGMLLFWNVLDCVRSIGAELWTDYHRIRLVNHFRRLGPEASREARGSEGRRLPERRFLRCSEHQQICPFGKKMSCSELKFHKI